jgi:hypothetical protein
VPVRLIGRRVRVLLHASEVVIYQGRAEIARHERLVAGGAVRLELDHYLEGLSRKPSALPGATPLEQARAAGKFTPVHDAWWEAVRKVHGDDEGTRALVEAFTSFPLNTTTCSGTLRVSGATPVVPGSRTGLYRGESGLHDDDQRRRGRRQTGGAALDGVSSRDRYVDQPSWRRQIL